MQDLSSKGFKSVSLGNRILRADTAPICALSIIQYELGDIE
ncbi:16S rRNA (uracil(1498)-N(3))-methyltransferase [Finegoldia magna]|nr:16S rRNA (uracil(1498)-N(3))-methyltransferase [Finegoldia magna]